MEPTPQQIQELRTKFLQKLEQQTPESGGVHPVDLAKIKNGDAWLRRFLTHNDCDMKETLDMLWEAVDWRNRVGANDITESSVSRSFLDGGVLFVRGKDKDDKPLLILKVKKHTKNHGDPEGLKKYCIYWFERLERMTKGDQVTLFFDMTDAGISNLDMELIKYLIGMFKTNYPYFLNFILVFEMPWVMTAAFKIIKSMLPAKGVERLRVVTKSTLKEYVDADNALKCWGGKDDYDYVFESENFAPTKSGRGDDSRKKVTFAENSLNDPSGDCRNDMKAGDSMYSGSNLVSISPNEFLTFSNNDGSYLSGTITLTNTSDGNISYKIKTTTPDKFRVRPSTGILTAGSTVTITILLQHGYQIPAYSRDKFMVMCLPIESDSMDAQELSDLWKQSKGNNVEQHQLRCNIGSAPWNSDSPARAGSALASNSSDVDRQLATILKSVNELKEAQNKLHGELRCTRRLQWLSITFIVLFAGVAYFFNKRYEEEDVCYPMLHDER